MLSNYNIDDARKKLSSSNIVCITMDIDWASEYVIKSTVEYFTKLGIPLTIFCTHPSNYLANLKSDPIIDLGIHPNFIQPSSQGKNIEDIIQYCIDIVPDARAFRCHRWYACNDIYDILYKKGFRYESNICTMFDVVPPFIHRSGMISFPVFFEDGAFIFHDFDLNFNSTKMQFDKMGLKVINIHPMHFMLNTPYFKYTRDIKDRLTREEWNNMDEVTVSKLNYNGKGITDYIKSLIEYSYKANAEFVTLKNIYNMIMN
jgi:hypothetical protein